jgi:hypothetical protein
LATLTPKFPYPGIARRSPPSSMSAQSVPVLSPPATVLSTREPSAHRGRPCRAATRRCTVLCVTSASKQPRCAPVDDRRLHRVQVIRTRTSAPKRGRYLSIGKKKTWDRPTKASHLNLLHI